MARNEPATLSLPPSLPPSLAHVQIQLTDFENAAFTVFVVLLTRAILSFKLNFYIPISKVARANYSPLQHCII